MAILVVYATKGGSTAEIAERIAHHLRLAGQHAEAMPVGADVDPANYDAVVVGSGVYVGSWLKEAIAYVRRHRAALAARPVWLFSSGPLGTATTDKDGRDLREVTIPKQIAEFQTLFGPRDHRVFFGAFDSSTCGLGVRILRLFPVGRKLLVEGDFRDWGEIQSWAELIAAELPTIAAADAHTARLTA